MKLIIKKILPFLAFTLLFSVRAMAEGNVNEIKDGIYAGKINLSGMTEDEAHQAIEDYVEKLQNATFELGCVSGNRVSVEASELGISWSNPEIVSDAASIGRSGNIIRRYKDLSDLKKNNKVYDIDFSMDDEKIRQAVSEKCTVFNTKAKNAELIPGSNGGFTIHEGENGSEINVDASVEAIKDYINSGNAEDGG